MLFLPTGRRFWKPQVVAFALLIFAFTAASALAANISGDGTLVGTSGNDNINAGNGNDTIYGLGGSDNINAGNGNDMIDGGGKCMSGSKNTEYCSHGQTPPCGHDNFNVGNGNDTIWGNCGTNSINAGSGNDTIYGGPLGDTINVNGRNSGTDYIYLGSGGNNNVSTGQGTTIVYAQNGKKDNIACHGNTTVYADSVDQTSNCTRVIHTPEPSADAHKIHAAKSVKHNKKKRSARHKRARHASAQRKG